MKKVCPLCGHDEIYETTGWVEARQVIEWSEDGTEALDYGPEERIDGPYNYPLYVCPFCVRFFDKPLLVLDND